MESFSFVLRLSSFPGCTQRQFGVWFCEAKTTTDERATANVARLETMDLDRLSVETETFLLVGEEFLHVLSLVSLKLDDLTHLGIGHYGAIAGCPCVSQPRSFC